jgi:excisionase family DNA binding protein
MAATITRKLVSLTDAADILAVSTKTVRRYIADGHLEAVRLGRKTLRIKVDSIDTFIDARPVGGWRRAGFRGSLRSHLNHRRWPASRTSTSGGRSNAVRRARSLFLAGSSKWKETLERASDLRFCGGRYWV